MTYRQSFYILHRQKNYVYIRYIFCFVYIAYGKILYTIQTIFCLHYVQKKCPYAIQTKTLLSISAINILSICHVEKSIFVYTSQRQIFYTRYRQNIIVYSIYRQYIININQKNYLDIFIYYRNSIHNSIFTLINSVYIKSEK